MKEIKCRQCGAFTYTARILHEGVGTQIYLLECSSCDQIIPIVVPTCSSPERVADICTKAWRSWNTIETVEKPKYLIGQRVILNKREIGTVECEAYPVEGRIFILSPSSVYPSYYNLCNVEPLPGGQL